MAKYFDELKRSMELIAQEPNSVFVGQAVQYAGTAMSNTLKDVDKSKLVEWPVCEDFQMGATIGMALHGLLPVSIFPRWNFLLLGANQLVNHLDKIYDISDYRPGVIIRTGVGSIKPLHPQAQHCADFTEAFRLMLDNVQVIRLDSSNMIFPAYEVALARAKAGESTVVVEVSDMLNTD